MTINPYGNLEAQKEAILSWCREYEVYSVNTEQEIEIAKDIFPQVSFIKTENTYKIGSRTLIRLDGILDAIRSTDAKRFAIVNSDIILRKRIGLDKKLDGSLIIATRWELGDVPSYPFSNGYDLFIFDVRNIALLYNKNYVIGMPWWDFWIPIVVSRAGIKIHHIKNDVILHRTHDTNYEQETWHMFANLFYSDIKALGAMWKIDDSILRDPVMEDNKFCNHIKRFIESVQINIKSK